MDAIGLLELRSLARGYRALDALVKRSPVTVLEANLVEPGHFLILVAGGVAEVNEAMTAGLEVAGDLLVDSLELPMVHPKLLPGLAGTQSLDADPDTLGIVETRSVAAALLACDRVLKEAYVELCGLRITPGLGGRGYFVVVGEQHDVESAMETAQAAVERGLIHETQVVPRPHPDFVAQVLRPAPFALQMEA
ncbi:MAG: BMC domain-containing protein [Myxococcota bacterium]|nr:BMC domain-containing protein [Myxococcota bacterium]